MSGNNNRNGHEDDNDAGTDNEHHNKDIAEEIDIKVMKAVKRNVAISSCHSIEQYSMKSISREKTLENSFEVFNAQRTSIISTVHLRATPATILYIIYRNDVLRHLSVSQWFRHFLPYPLLILSVWCMQVSAFVLMNISHTSTADQTETSVILAARLIALVMLGYHTLTTSNAQREALKCILYDAFHTHRMYVLFLLCPLLQAGIEVIALRICSEIVLQANTAAQVFKDAMSLIVILELDNWISDSLSKSDLGLDEGSMVIMMDQNVFKKANPSKPRFFKLAMLCHIITVCCKLGVLAFDIYYEVTHS